MKRTLVALTAAATLLLTACGGSSDEGTATDPVATGESDSPEETTAPEPEMIGDYPAYPYADYSYDLEVQCFCPVMGQPIRVTVTGGEVTDAVFTTKADGVARGAQATEEWLRLSIDDVLREAADPSYDKVDVTWPEGTDHPEKVAIDRMENAIDDEVTYVISNVTPS
jgi:hypothetical protein